MANTLIGCGGTGAHVALALTRLHALGDPLGFFRRGGAPMDMPDLYLVDQDSGDAESADKPAAWQALRHVLDGHPSHTRNGAADTGRRWPDPRAVTPLPVGANQDFLAEGMNTLKDRYPRSSYLRCILSPHQRDIEFSRGMMGSPAVGSLLFKLKSYDVRTDDPDINHDEYFHQLCAVQGRVAVVGSGVGGTGAAVGPTLAEHLSGVAERQVMAVMLLNWFEFDETYEHLGENRIRAQRRNRVMQENAHSGLRYYGSRLAEHVATVPVGIPRRAMSQRIFSGDNHQPKHEAFPHAVAAICCLRQFLGDDAYSEGLYHLDADDPRRLGSLTGLPGGGTVGDLAAQGKKLVDTIKTYEKVLGSSGGGYVQPILCELLGARRQEAAENLAKLRERYAENLEWLEGMLGGDSPEPIGASFTREVAVRQRLQSDRLDIRRLGSADQAASEVFRWLAAWVRDASQTSAPSNPKGVYWPEMRPDSGIAPTPRQSGALQKVQRANVRATLDSFVNPALMTQNGWPHPLAAADHFREAVTDGSLTALRRLELLFLGLFMGELELRLTERGDSRTVSLDQLVHDHRTGQNRDLLRYAVERAGPAGGVMGFTAPDTVLCPVPGLPDAEWSELWRSVTGLRDADWKAAGGSWEAATSSAGRIRAWIEACIHRNAHSGPPAWTKIFEGSRAEPGYGGGKKLRIRWSRDKWVDVFLPTQDEGGQSDDERVRDPEEAATRARDFVSRHGEVTESGKLRFSRVSFEIAGEGKVDGFWIDHLRHLQQEGKIATFSAAADRREVHVREWLPDGGHRRVTLPRTLLLRMEDIGIRSCTPMRQERVPGSDAPTVLYPNYPVRWRYFDLLTPPGDERGESLLDLLKRGEDPGTPPQPEIDERRRQATWTLGLRGLGAPVRFAVRLGRLEEHHKAHWMVWPRFHAADWKAYYVYQHCTNRHIHVDTLWLDKRETGVALARTRASDQENYPVRFSQRDGLHAGGPPLALCASRGSDEIGLYVVRLDRLQPARLPMQIGVDFGTSHTTAAVKLGSRDAQPVELRPELSRGPSDAGLSLHVSENMEHVEGVGRDGLVSQGTWFPQYVKAAARELLAGLWPSEILTIETVQTLANQRSEIQSWEPMRDYVIPPAGVLRSDLAKHVIANFKWNTSEEFKGRESDLRKIYLDRIVEQVLAEAFVRHGRPSDADEIRFTFTYPLRTPVRDVTEYHETLQRVLDDGTSSLGSRLALREGVGLFDESRATKVGTGRFGDVNMVGDLGGGTLDLIISAEGGQFRDTADSVKLGGHELLRLIADHNVVPPGWGDDSDARFANLTAWVRTKGITALFGPRADRVDRCNELNVRGFGNPAGPRPGQRIVRRYFYLVSEFMARSLTAYLARHWLPNVSAAQRDRLRIRVYLRGNGWHLWHENKDYGAIQAAVQKRARAAARRLWPIVEASSDLPGDDEWFSNHHGNAKADLAKRAVVKEVVGQSEDPKSVRGNWFSHTLVELAQEQRDGRRAKVEWFDKIPFRTGGEATRIEFAAVRPEIPLSSPSALRVALSGIRPGGAGRETIGKLPDDLTRQINVLIKDQGEFVGDDQLDYQGPIAAWVWEMALKRMIVDPVGGR